MQQYWQAILILAKAVGRVRCAQENLAHNHCHRAHRNPMGLHGGYGIRAKAGCKFGRSAPNPPYFLQQYVS